MLIVGVAAEEFDGLCDLAGDGEGETTRDEVEMAPVEDGEGDGLEDDQREPGR